jgi:hypothetical protein
MLVQGLQPWRGPATDGPRGPQLFANPVDPRKQGKSAAGVRLRAQLREESQGPELLFFLVLFGGDSGRRCPVSPGRDLIREA